ncbi:winged helix-turn-helix transcriptional regulator [Nakamurella sp. GG22]
MSAAGTSLDDRSIGVVGGRLRSQQTPPGQMRSEQMRSEQMRSEQLRSEQHRSEQLRAGGLRAAGRLLVLLACDDDEASVLRAGWVGQSVDIQHRCDLGEVLYLAGRAAPDVIVVGTGGAGLRVIDFLRILRQVDCRTPVIVGVPGSPPAMTDAIPAGATAVVPLPLAASPVLQAVEASIGDGSAFRAQPMALDLGRLRVDGSGPRIWIDGVQSVIPPMEFLLLRYLAERHDQIISRDELVSAVWGEPVTLHSNSLSVHIARLRRRFDRSAGESWIRPVRGFGYQLTVAARPAGKPTEQRARRVQPQSR